MPKLLDDWAPNAYYDGPNAYFSARDYTSTPANWVHDDLKPHWKEHLEILRALSAEEFSSVLQDESIVAVISGDRDSARAIGGKDAHGGDTYAAKVLAGLTDVLIGNPIANNVIKDRLSNGFYRTLKNNQNLTSSARAILKKWHRDTGSSVPNDVVVQGQFISSSPNADAKLDEKGFGSLNQLEKKQLQKSYSLSDRDLEFAELLSRAKITTKLNTLRAVANVSIPQSKKQDSARTLKNALHSPEAVVLDNSTTRAVSRKLASLMETYGDTMGSFFTRVEEIHRNTGALEPAEKKIDFNGSLELHKGLLTKRGLKILNRSETIGLPVGSDAQVEIFCLKCERVEYRTIKNTHAAMKAGTISCRACGVARGLMETAFYTACKAKAFEHGMSKDSVQDWFSFPGRNLPYDGIITTPSQGDFLYEGDGPLHWEGWHGETSGPKIEGKFRADETKTEDAAAHGKGLIRFYVGSSTELEFLHFALIQKLYAGAIPAGSYIVVGKESPGAARADKSKFSNVIRIETIEDVEKL